MIFALLPLLVMLASRARASPTPRAAGPVCPFSNYVVSATPTPTASLAASGATGVSVNDQGGVVMTWSGYETTALVTLPMSYYWPNDADEKNLISVGAAFETLPPGVGVQWVQPITSTAWVSSIPTVCAVVDALYNTAGQADLTLRENYYAQPTMFSLPPSATPIACADITAGSYYLKTPYAFATRFTAPPALLAWELAPNNAFEVIGPPPTESAVAWTINMQPANIDVAWSSGSSPTVTIGPGAFSPSATGVAWPFAATAPPTPASVSVLLQYTRAAPISTVTPAVTTVTPFLNGCPVVPP